MNLARGAFILAAALALAPGPSRADPRPSLADATSFGYQLQRYRMKSLAASKYDVLVIDAETDEGGELRPWTPEEIAALQAGPCGRRIVLAYVSIGEAEDYRSYWPGLDKSVVASQNPDWKGNYRVHFWEPAWQSVIYGTDSGPDESYVDRVIDQGFDGVYLDVVDAFEFWGPDTVGGNNERPTAAEDMVSFVSGIARHARKDRGRTDFLVVPQNGASIISPDAYSYDPEPGSVARAQKQGWFALIDGIGAEDSYFRGIRRQNNRLQPDDYVLRLLDQFHAAGKPVFAVDYVTQRQKVRRFYRDAKARGFLPFAAGRSLDRIRGPRGRAPKCD